MNPLRIIVPLAFTLILTACGSSSADTKKDADKKDKQAKSSDSKGAGNNTVTIDGPAQKRSDIQVADIEPRQIQQTLMAAGQIAINEDRTVHVGSYSDGRVTEVLATIGDFVRNGQTLATIHSHMLHETRGAYELALQEIRLKENALAYAQRLATRMHNLYAVKSASVQEVEHADAEVVNAKTGLNSAQIKAEQERQHLADILRVDPSKVTLTSSEHMEMLPILSSITGTVIDRKVTPGAVVQSGDETFTVTDLSSVWMLASVNETDVGKIRVGHHARVMSQAYPDQSFTGIVTRLGAQMDPQTRTLQVRIVIPNPRMQLRPEMFANAQIEEGPTRSGIFVPEEAIQDINGSPVVFLRGANNKFTASPVQIARTLNGEAEIQSGLKPGDHVVTKGSFVVKSEMLKSQIGE